MELLPGLRDAFASFAAMGTPPDGLTTAERRAWIHERIDETFTALNEERPPVASEVDHRIAVDGGEITARVYRPDVDGPLPCYLHLHGGGFWLGTLEQSESACRGIATDVGCVVVDLDYRLAPEHKYPVAADDSYAALLWIAEHAGELGVDASRIAVGGGSAGGNLAAVVALMARDRGGPALVLQVLEIGVFDLERHIGQETIDFYLADPSDAQDPYASPLKAPDLRGLPPAVVTSAEFDALAPEDAEYAEALRNAGVPVEETFWEGQFHGSMGMAKLIPDEARAYHEMIVGALRRAFTTA
jgi:acetyl esterase